MVCMLLNTRKICVSLTAEDLKIYLVDVAGFMVIDSADKRGLF